MINGENGYTKLKPGKRKGAALAAPRLWHSC
jgi:hypothetical protein